MKKNILIIGSVIIILLLPLWYFAVVPEFEKMPVDYKFSIDLFGTDNVYDLESDEFMGEKVTNIKRSISAHKSTKETVTVKDVFAVNELSGKLIYQIEQDFIVNRNTKVIERTSQLAYFEFPRNVEKKEYPVWFYYINNPEIASFEKTEEIQGLTTFVFFLKHKFDNTLGVAEGNPLVPEKYNTVAELDAKIWVEPKTGIIVKMEDYGSSSYVEKTDDVFTADIIKPFLKWTNKYSSDSTSKQVLIAQNERFKLLLIKTIIPLLLVVAIALITFFLSLNGETKE